MLNDSEVFGPHPEHRGTIDLGLAPHEVCLLRMQVLSILVLPGFLCVVPIVEEDGGSVLVELFLRHKGPALKDEDVLSSFGQMESQCSSARSCANDDRVVLSFHEHWMR
jgi:hypothetical protein